MRRFAFSQTDPRCVSSRGGFCMQFNATCIMPSGYGRRPSQQKTMKPHQHRSSSARRSPASPQPPMLSVVISRSTDSSESWCLFLLFVALLVNHGAEHGEQNSRQLRCPLYTWGTAGSRAASVVRDLDMDVKKNAYPLYRMRVKKGRTSRGGFQFSDNSYKDRGDISITNCLVTSESSYTCAWHCQNIWRVFFRTNVFRVTGKRQMESCLSMSNNFLSTNPKIQSFPDNYSMNT